MNSPQSPPPADPDGPAVRVTEVDVVFSARRADPVRALRGVDFAIPAGTIFCLLGPNGSGKTTAVNLITGLLRPSRGEVAVLGLDPVRDRRELLRRIALVPQETALYGDLTGRENLEFHARYYGVPPREVPRRVDQALELVGLTDRARHRAGTYSGGMQRRLALARALLTRPRVLLLDEPTLGVDVQSRQAIWDRIGELADAGGTVLLTTNYMEEADRLGREVLIIDRGAPVVRGTPARLKALAGATGVEVDFAEPAVRDQAGRALADLSPTTGPNGELEVAVPGGADPLPFLRQVIDRVEPVGGVRAVRLREPSLHDVFLHFTGHALRN